MQSRPPLYADHHATTQLHPAALEAMLPWLRESANPSSVHAPGRAARRAVEDARATLADCLGASPAEIVFTSGGTESDNLAVRGGAEAARAADPSRNLIVVSTVEHAAVRESARGLLPRGFELVELPVDGDGLPLLEDAGVLGPRLALLSLILANNETGAILDAFPAFAARARESGGLVHTDAVQAVGKIPVNVDALGVDLLSLTGHKFGGPKGAGALYVRKGTPLAPLVTGGGQEKGRRSGTENVAGVVGLATALRCATDALETEGARLASLRDGFERELARLVPGVRFHATRRASTRRLPTVSSVSFPGVDGEMLLIALDLEGIAASSGSACASGTRSPSRVLLACGLPAGEVRSTLRFSFGRTTIDEDIARLLETLPALAARAAVSAPA